MLGIYYLLSIIAVFTVLIWYIRNDDTPEDKPTHGLLAFKVDMYRTKKIATTSDTKSARWRHQRD